MSNKIPVERSIAWSMVIPQIIVMIVLVVASFLFLRDWNGAPTPFWGFVIYLAYSQGSRLVLLGSHRRGMALMKQGENKAAIEQFEKSYAFFSQYPWIDQYRYLTMLIPAKLAYREMALTNSAVCYAQLEDLENTKAFCERTLREFPDNAMAKNLLDHIDSKGKET